jgi:hypothetical protein
LRVPLRYVAAFALVPSAIAFGLLHAQKSQFADIAATTYRATRIPLINASGIVDPLYGAVDASRTSRPISIFGRYFGSDAKQVRVLVDGRPAKLLYWSESQINAEVAPGTHDSAIVTVEANGCQGNGFPLHLN